VFAHLVILLALGLDTLAIAISFGLSGIAKAHRLRIGLILGFYSAVMLGLGLAIGESLNDAAARAATVIAGLGLIAAGVHGLIEHRRASEYEEAFEDMAAVEDLVFDTGDRSPQSFSDWRRTVHLMALVGSVDKFAVGLILGAEDVQGLPMIAYLAAQSVVLGVVGVSLGDRLGVGLGHRAELASKALLAVIGAGIIAAKAKERPEGRARSAVVSDASITFAILGAVIVLFVWNRLPIEVVAIGAALALVATSVLEIDQALSGFGDQAVIFIAALLIVSAALDVSGVTSWAGRALVKRAGDSKARLLILTMLLAALLTPLISVNAPWRRCCPWWWWRRTGCSRRLRSC
jgi:putative Mn2+ efflux pump MntP